MNARINPKSTISQGKAPRVVIASGTVEELEHRIKHICKGQVLRLVRRQQASRYLVRLLITSQTLHRKCRRHQPNPTGSQPGNRRWP